MRTLCQILLIFLAVVTLCICVIKPDMHKSVIVYNSDYELVSDEDKTIEPEGGSISELPVKTQQITTKVTNDVQKKIKIVQSPEKKQSASKQSVKTQAVKQNSNTITRNDTVINQNSVRQEPAKEVKAESQLITKTLTQQEEEIAWNIWRSNLQNKIMQDVKLPVMPNGIIFRFSFTVDKYGKVSNVQSWSTTSAYTPYAIQYISPVIRSYQGKDILNFPQGSTRTVTDVKGGWKLSTVEKYSTPQDYNDIEKVVK